MSYRCDRVRGSTVAYHTAVKEDTVWKLSKYRAFSRPYFRVFSPNAGKYGQEKTPYLDTFHAVKISMGST